MHSRFWTFCAGANIFLYLMTVAVVFINKDKIKRLDVSLFHRDIVGWGSGSQVWRDFYNSNPDNVTYSNFLPLGMAAVGCTEEYSAPLCHCLEGAHARPCIASGKEAMQNCFMNQKPVIKIVELDRSLNVINLLTMLNMWGLLGSIVTWIRMYICRDGVTMPYYIQFVIGLFAAIIPCVVLESYLSSFFIYIAAVLLMSFITYLHKEDKTWWVTMYMIQYAFTVPNMVIFCYIGTQKRDFLYLLLGFFLATAYGLMSLGRTLLDEACEESVEARNSYNMSRAAMIFIMLVLTFSAYQDEGHYWFRSFSTTPSVHSLSIILLFYLFLGLLCPNNLKRVCISDWCIRFVVSMHLVTDLIIAP